MWQSRDTASLICPRFEPGGREKSVKRELERKGICSHSRTTSSWIQFKSSIQPGLSDICCHSTSMLYSKYRSISLYSFSKAQIAHDSLIIWCIIGGQETFHTSLFTNSFHPHLSPTLSLSLSLSLMALCHEIFDILMFREFSFQFFINAVLWRGPEIHVIILSLVLVEFCV